MTYHMGLLVSDIPVHGNIDYSAVIWLEIYIGDMFCMPFAIDHCHPFNWVHPKNQQQ